MHADEFPTWVLAQTSPTCAASLSEHGRVNQAEGYSEADPQGSVCEAPGRHCHDPSRPIDSEAFSLGDPAASPCSVKGPDARLPDSRRQGAGGRSIAVARSVSAMSFPQVGDSSSAFALSLGADGMTINADIVPFREGQVVGDIAYADFSV